MQGADLAVLPYESKDQVTSGVLTESLAAGLPVVATAFPHAIELLSDGAGIVVPHSRPGEMARAMEYYLSNTMARRRASQIALTVGRSFRWEIVAAKHERLARRLIDRPTAIMA
jgi:glycosyltransferase involved in cell wall biosynthesis